MFSKRSASSHSSLSSAYDTDWMKYRLLLVVALIALVGGAGFFIWQANRLQKNEAEAGRLLSEAKGPGDWTAVVERYPQSSAAADAIMRLAYQATEEAHYDQAMAYYHRIVHDFPSHPASPACELALAACLEALGKNAEARASYQKIANAEPPHPFAPPALLGLARLDFQEGRASNARQLLTTFVAEHPDSPFQPNARQMLEKLSLTNSDSNALSH